METRLEIPKKVNIANLFAFSLHEHTHCVNMHLLIINYV